MSSTQALSQLLQATRSARTRNDIFTGVALPTLNGRSFGGQIMGQAVSASGQTVANDRQLHSLHGYFVRPGDSAEPTTFEVDHIFDGRSFSTRRTQAFQAGSAIMSLIASFQVPAVTAGFADVLDTTGLLDPDRVPSLADKYGHLIEHPEIAYLLNRPFEFRYLDGDILTAPPKPQARQRVWMRARDTLGEDQLLNRAALAFGSDYLFIEPALRGLGLSWQTPQLRVASLDHAVWFHRDVRTDDWLLYDLECVFAGSGRALSRGRFFTQAGELVASCAQEVMLRVPRETSGV